MHNESKVAARRTYQFYSKFKGNWKGLTSRKFFKIKKEKYFELLKGREELERKILLAFLELSADHMIEDHVQEQYMTDHIVKDYDLQNHVTTENHMKDHPDRKYMISDQHTMLVG